MNRGGSQAVKNRPDPRDGGGSGEVLPFRRPSQPPLFAAPGHPADYDGERQDDNLPDDFAQFEQDQDDVVDYRQRALMNVIALAVLAFLIGIGVWLADTIAHMERDQDCMMQGRVNCDLTESAVPPQQ